MYVADIESYTVLITHMWQAEGANGQNRRSKGFFMACVNRADSLSRNQIRINLLERYVH